MYEREFVLRPLAEYVAPFCKVPYEY
jgi:7,8-dihydro-6-hydroxymethylpterin-pyrophosphokinase